MTISCGSLALTWSSLSFTKLPPLSAGEPASATTLATALMTQASNENSWQITSFMSPRGTKDRGLWRCFGFEATRLESCQVLPKVAISWHQNKWCKSKTFVYCKARILFATTGSRLASRCEKSPKNITSSALHSDSISPHKSTSHPRGIQPGFHPVSEQVVQHQSEHLPPSEAPLLLCLPCQKKRWSVQPNPKIHWQAASNVLTARLEEKSTNNRSWQLVGKLHLYLMTISWK